MKVRAAEDMPEVDFIQHLNLRHFEAGEFADLRRLDLQSSRSEKDRRVLEAYHQRLHETKEYQHGH